ncbi:hypothetical protein [Haladaptatus sp. CMAA 1911]|uniref:hypothetical protein n=1 Tax=unclassified Haladaptatus TaxID=2622732 RepID=UPI0037552396
MSDSVRRAEQVVVRFAYSNLLASLVLRETVRSRRTRLRETARSDAVFLRRLRRS